MAERKFTAALIALLFTIAACMGKAEDSADAFDEGAGVGETLVLEGRIEEGAECPILTTAEGRSYALSFNGGDPGPGDHVRVTGEVALAAFCQQGEGTLIVKQIAHTDPPARDRDGARAGATRLTDDDLAGSWVAQGEDADCERPAFRIVASSAVVVLKAQVEGHEDSIRVALDRQPRLDLDEPLPDLPIEPRGADGLAILPPASDAGYEPITIGGERIAGEAVEFVKCAG